VLKAEVSHASDQVADALQLPERALVMSLERIRLADGEPMALMHHYLPAGLVQLTCTAPPGTRSPPASPGRRQPSDSVSPAVARAAARGWAE